MHRHLKTVHKHAKLVWHFLWNEDSLASWLANLVIAFVVIRYAVYPILGVILGTGFPIVAVVSSSMDHGIADGKICGQQMDEFHESFDNYWDLCGHWYKDIGISKEQFRKYPFPGGFYKGDVIVLWRANRNNVGLGDVLVFVGNKPQPIIHRVVKGWEEDGNKFYQTKGDHNSDSISGDMGEKKISEERMLGKAIFRVPYLGWLKILFVDAVRPLGIVIER